MALTKKQELFVKEYLIDLNATQAAIRAGYSKKTAYAIGAENLKKPQIQEAISAVYKPVMEDLDITIERVLKELSCSAFLDIRELFDANGNMKAIKDLPEEVARSIGGIEHVTVGGKDDEASIQYTSKIRLIDKKGSLELLGKHLKMFADRVEHTGEDGGPIKHENVSDLELARRMAFILKKGEIAMQEGEKCH